MTSLKDDPSFSFSELRWIFGSLGYNPVSRCSLPHKLGVKVRNYLNQTYSVFHQFRQAKSVYSGSIVSSSPFLLLPQLFLKTMLAIKVVKMDSKIIILLPWYKHYSVLKSVDVICKLYFKLSDQIQLMNVFSMDCFFT